jgi:hypothetical protein
MINNLSSGLKNAWGFLAKSAATVKQKSDEAGFTQGVQNMGQTIKQTSDSYGVTGALVQAKNTVSKYGHKAAEFTTESGRGIYESAKDGSLQ